tara:strand:- start:2457 stop:2666 length:210 start_codon:yes stop_codon:yes gene_type:complete
MEKTVKIMEGPWEKSTFPNGVETTNVISRTTTILYEQDGYLCEKTSVREYRDNDYFDTSSSKRIVKLNG